MLPFSDRGSANFVVDSGLSFLELRDISLARAEEEDAREIALRIPRSERLQSHLIELAHDSQRESDGSNSGAAEGGGLSRRPSAVRISYSSRNRLR